MIEEDRCKFEILNVPDSTGQRTIIVGKIIEGKIRVGFLTEPLYLTDGTTTRVPFLSFEPEDNVITNRGNIRLVLDLSPDRVKIILSKGRIIEFSEE